MGTTIEDIQYDEYIEGLHEAYINALEKLPKSKSLVDLRKNLENLRKVRANTPDWARQESKQFEILESALNDITTIEKIYEMLIEQKKRGNLYFVMGFGIGAVVTVLSSLFL